MKLVIGIVNYNCFEYTRNLINSIRKYPPSYPYSIIVLDNASKDKSKEFLKNIKDVKLIFKSKNLGFGKGCNDIARRTDSEYLLFLNPDILITENAMDNLIKFMDNNLDCAISGGKLLNPDGTIQYSCRRFPTLFNVFFGRENFFTRFIPGNRFTRKYMCIDMDYDKNNQVDWLRGAVFMVRRSVFDKLEGFDERYFLFLEDTDLCLRVKKEGYKVYFVSNAVFYHKLGGCVLSNPLRNKIIHNYSFYKYFKKTLANKFLNLFLDYAFIARFGFIIFTGMMERISK